MLRRLVPLALLIGAGCNTAVGNYFANRGRDFGECLRAEAHFGMGLFVEARASGFAHSAVGIRVSSSIAGWRYGQPIADTFGVFAWEMEGGLGLFHRAATHRGEHVCFALLPGVLAWHPRFHDSPLWIGHSDVPNGERRANWDIELTVHVLWGGLTLGFSPTEFVDFLLGWFGLDIAHDDVPLLRGEHR